MCVVAIGGHIPASWFTICRESIPKGLRSPAAKPACRCLFSLSEIEMVFAHLFLLPAYSYSDINSGGAGTLACVGHEAEKYPIHHGDSRDKHIYTKTNVGFFGPPDLHVCGSLFYFLCSPVCIYHDQNTCAYIK